ncbi:hypothetical protein [Halodesulfovibrio aestuarii]|uniref:Phage protein n=1 Tax=Halodesulfovibrio aestuarii TaxID=126333 RepID=A0ABV4JTV7_9BACT
MKNKLTDLNNHLFEQLERLNDDELTGADLKQEINRSRAMTDVAQQIIENGRLALDAVKVANKGYSEDKPLPPMLEV